MFEFVILIMLAGLVISVLAGLGEAILSALRRPDRRDWRDLNR
jgi:hypothetical protein